jgi:hypothetical protein
MDLVRKCGLTQANKRATPFYVEKSLGTPDVPACDGCGRAFGGTIQCSRCESAFYFGRECLVLAWETGGHKDE